MTPVLQLGQYSGCDMYSPSLPLSLSTPCLVRMATLPLSGSNTTILSQLLVLGGLTKVAMSWKEVLS